MAADPRLDHDGEDRGPLGDQLMLLHSMRMKWDGIGLAAHYMWQAESIHYSQVDWWKHAWWHTPPAPLRPEVEYGPT